MSRSGRTGDKVEVDVGESGIGVIRVGGFLGDLRNISLRKLLAEFLRRPLFGEPSDDVRRLIFEGAGVVSGVTGRSPWIDEGEAVNGGAYMPNDNH